MRGYASEPASRDAHMAALHWLEPEHDTGLVRGLGRKLRDSGSPLFCVWTGRHLTADFDIDHCFPFAAWPCNDLWNLLPSSGRQLFAGLHEAATLPWIEIQNQVRHRLRADFTMCSTQPRRKVSEARGGIASVKHSIMRDGADGASARAAAHWPTSNPCSWDQHGAQAPGGGGAGTLRWLRSARCASLPRVETDASAWSGTSIEQPSVALSPRLRRLAGRRGVRGLGAPAQGFATDGMMRVRRAHLHRVVGLPMLIRRQPGLPPGPGSACGGRRLRTTAIDPGCWRPSVRTRGRACARRTGSGWVVGAGATTAPMPRTRCICMLEPAWRERPYCPPQLGARQKSESRGDLLAASPMPRWAMHV